jgi:D-3-phosphoglycerate dehydrogenase
VNAPVIAAERGVEVREERSRRRATSRTSCESKPSRKGVRSASQGTTIGNDDRQWLVSALGFELDMELAPLLVFFRYDDVPGVIGRVGTLFGEAGVNIANMTVSRTRRGGQALMALSIDTPAPPELVDQLHGEFEDARFISLASGVLCQMRARETHDVCRTVPRAKLARPLCGAAKAAP